MCVYIIYILSVYIYIYIVCVCVCVCIFIDNTFVFYFVTMLKESFQVSLGKVINLKVLPDPSI